MNKIKKEFALLLSLISVALFMIPESYAFYSNELTENKIDNYSINRPSAEFVDYKGVSHKLKVYDKKTQRLAMGLFSKSNPFQVYERNVMVPLSFNG